MKLKEKKKENLQTENGKQTSPAYLSLNECFPPQ